MYCVEESFDENPNWLEESVVRDIFSKIRVATKSAGKIHCLGQKLSGKQRPIIVKIHGYSERMEIFHSHKLKGTGFSIGEDLSTNVRQTRKEVLQ